MKKNKDFSFMFEKFVAEKFRRMWYDKECSYIRCVYVGIVNNTANAILAAAPRKQQTIANERERETVMCWVRTVYIDTNSICTGYSVWALLVTVFLFLCVSGNSLSLVRSFIVTVYAERYSAMTQVRVDLLMKYMRLYNRFVHRSRSVLRILFCYIAFDVVGCRSASPLAFFSFSLSALFILCFAEVFFLFSICIFFLCLFRFVLAFYSLIFVYTVQLSVMIVCFVLTVCFEAHTYSFTRYLSHERRSSARISLSAHISFCWCSFFSFCCFSFISNHSYEFFFVFFYSIWCSSFSAVAIGRAHSIDVIRVVHI